MLTSCQPASVVGPMKLMLSTPKGPGMARPAPKRRTFGNCVFNCSTTRDDGKGLSRRRVLDLLARSGDDGSAEIDKGHLDQKRRDLDTEGVAAVGVDLEGAGRKSTAGRLQPGREKETVLFKLPHDVGDGLHREAGAVGNLVAGDGTMQANEFQHDPSVEGSAYLLIGSSQRHPIPLPKS